MVRLQGSVQLWITPEGKYIPIARLRPLFACYTDSWNWNTDMEVRSVNSCYDINPNFVYPWTRVIPALKRNGFRGELYGCSPLRLFQTLLTNNRAETLLKVGQYPMFCHEVKRAYVPTQSIGRPCGFAYAMAIVSPMVRYGAITSTCSGISIKISSRPNTCVQLTSRLHMITLTKET